MNNCESMLSCTIICVPLWFSVNEFNLIVLSLLDLCYQFFPELLSRIVNWLCGILCLVIDFG